MAPDLKETLAQVDQFEIDALTMVKHDNPTFKTTHIRSVPIKTCCWQVLQWKTFSTVRTIQAIPKIGPPPGCYPAPAMEAKGLTPILNVSDIAGTFAWFEKWGWKKLWDWGTPPTFGAVGSGKETCIFLCQGAQGGRGRGANTTTFQRDGDEQGDKGVWMSVWVDDVDEMHKHCVAVGLEVTLPPTDMPWNVREMHLRHPDGHVFRVSRGFKPEH